MSGPSFDRTEPCSSTWKDLPDALSALWDTCMQNRDGEDVARALTANLICVVEATARDELQAATALLQRRSPCRAFLLLLGDDGDEERRAELTAATRGRGTIRDIVLEEVVIPLAAGDLRRAPGLLRPLILDDLPSHLFWARPWPSDATSFDALRALCSHTIVDSRRFGNPARELQALADRREAGDAVTDLSWLRLQPWRRALAEAFDRFPFVPGTEVRATLRHGRDARAATMLLADWLVERLDAQVDVEPDGDARSPGPDHVALRAGSVEVTSELRDDALVTHVTTDEHCYLPFSVAARRASDAELLAAAIDRS